MATPISVLVVEAYALIRLDIVDYLEWEGFEVYEAANAAQAIKVLESHSSISILFTDIDMPGSMDGLKLSAAVRNRWPPIRIVVTSGHGDIATNDLPDGGIYLSKPYRHAELAKTFRDLVAGT